MSALGGDLGLARQSKRGVLLAAFALSVALAPAARAEPLSVDLGSGVRLELVRIEPGRFRQGSAPTEAGRGQDENSREVTLARGFYLGKTPVTRGQFARFVAETGYRTEAEKGSSGGFGFDGHGGLVQKKEFTWKNPGFAQTDEHPVTIVTYDDALAFTAWLGRKASREVTLPTEAQFEYAARAGTTTRFFAGNDDAVAYDVGWFKDNAGRGTQAVATKQANAFGLFDTSGNVYQWCRDWYGSSYAAGPATDPEVTEPPPGEEKARRVLRGGSWLKQARNLRSAARYRNAPGSRNADNGFRVVASLEVRSPSVDAPSAPVPAVPAPAPGAGPTTEPLDDEQALIVGMISLGLGAICCLGVVGLLVFAITRARRSGKVAFRTAADGFWIDAPEALRGSLLHWQCEIGGRPRTGSVTIEPAPAGQFVYTGATPSAVRMLELHRQSARGAAAGRAYRGAASTQHRSHSDDYWAEQQRDQQARAFQGYPSAY
jgi:formylglycine-generating enzyme